MRGGSNTNEWSPFPLWDPVNFITTKQHVDNVNGMNAKNKLTVRLPPKTLNVFYTNCSAWLHMAVLGISTSRTVGQLLSPG